MRFANSPDLSLMEVEINVVSDQRMYYKAAVLDWRSAWHAAEVEKWGNWSVVERMIVPRQPAADH